jgi:hypothetical protein
MAIRTAAIKGRAAADPRKMAGGAGIFVELKALSSIGAR